MTMRRALGLLATVLASVIASGAGIYGLWLLVIGPLLVIVVPGGGGGAFHDPNVAGAFPLAGAALVLFGIQSGRDRLALLGGVVLLVFSVLFLFSIGGILIPFALGLILVLTVRPFLAPRRGQPG